MSASQKYNHEGQLIDLHGSIKITPSDAGKNTAVLFLSVARYARYAMIFGKFQCPVFIKDLVHFVSLIAPAYFFDPHPYVVHFCFQIKEIYFSYFLVDNSTNDFAIGSFLYFLAPAHIELVDN